ncbi:MAG TPA: matrixin family metalloprotease [Longimicrobiaceae bacterium]|nr:matrixin family metalloprotease [Longimicrobiaceae bacterium]
MNESSADLRRIALVPIISTPGTDMGLGELGRMLEPRLGVSCFVDLPLRLDPEWFDADRDQFGSNQIIDALVERFNVACYDPGEVWMLGVTDADLHADGRNFVFGEATLGGCCALISRARLTDRPDRLVTEAIHELGHVAGLGHCDSPGCVMQPSPDVASIDDKSAEPCDRCALALLPDSIG